LKENT